MIWTIKDKGKVYFYTADNKKFDRIIDATRHLTIKFNSLKEKEKSFNTCFERNRKLKIIISKL